MQFKTLEYLEAIYLHKNFTKAAEIMYVSQPAISAAIRKLEEEFNTKLIIRTPKKVIFTPEGEEFLLRVRPVLQELRSIEAEMLSKNRKKKKVLRLGLSPTAPPHIVHQIYQKFLPSLNENEEVFFDEGGAYYHIEKLIHGEVDVAINVIPENISHFPVDTITLSKQEICLLIRSDSALAEYDKIPLEMLEETPITSLGASSYLPLRLEQEAEKHHIKLKIVSKHLAQTSYIEEILLGNSCGIINVEKNQIPRPLYAHKNLTTRPFQIPMYLEIGILFPQNIGSSALIKKTIKFIQEVAQEFE